MTSASPSQNGTPQRSRIPRLLRSSSFVESPRIKPPMNDEELEALDDVSSLSSICSVVSCSVPGPSYSSAVQSSTERRLHNCRHSKYAFHCSSPGTEHYLTPTQRANQTIKKLKALLSNAESNLRYKDFEIQRLTKELVELRLEHAQCKKTDDTGTSHCPPPSLADSGHFDDLNVRHSSKESLLESDISSNNWNAEKRRLISIHTDQITDLKRQHADEVQNIRARMTDRLEQALQQLGESNSRYSNLLASYDRTREQLTQSETELRIVRESITQLEQQLNRVQTEMEERETQEYEIREREISRIESLTGELKQKNKLVADLQLRLEQCNQENVRITNLEKEINQLQDAAQEQSARNEQLYLQMYLKGQEAARFENEIQTSDQVMPDNTIPVDVVEQLKVATAELQKYKELYFKELKLSSRHPEESMDSSVILKFLRSAVFYLLTDHDNFTGHLRAVLSILEFSPEERNTVDRCLKHGYL